jgi:hypothetical protein
MTGLPLLVMFSKFDSTVDAGTEGTVDTDARWAKAVDTLTINIVAHLAANRNCGMAVVISVQPKVGR